MASRNPLITGASRSSVRLADRKAAVEVEDRFLRLNEVLAIAAIGKTALYAKVKAGTFPAPCRPGGAGSRWSEREVRAWFAEVKAARAA